MTMNLSFDRYRTGIRASWKVGASAVYDLGSHLLDEALKLFGRPAKITAFVQNIRGVTKPEVDDIVRHLSVLFRDCILTGYALTVHDLLGL